MSGIKNHSYLIGLLYSLEFFITRIAVFISLVVYVLLGNTLAPQKIFVVTAIYNVIKPAVTIVFAMSITALFSVNVSLKRIENFLRNQDYVENPSGFTPNNLRHIDPRDLESNQVSLPIEPRVFILSGELVAIIGPVGSVKTSLLNMLLKEMIVISGDVDIQGRISHASQEPWFFAGSIQQNILFGESYDQDRYESVTHVCALLGDFQNFLHGDATLVGERGKALNGGQKSWVNLARCIYRKADIYILDDPLSAVDAKIGRHLYQKCIETFLGDKICILVTHQLQYLKTADKIIIMKDGRIEACGTFSELQNSGLDFA
ncbi:ATP-binding cassette sub-family C member 4-like [Coccinella septempunctata]|uniref:ATP-binding cassette sub-family C member 4-like n=1 Tax=Coccinella septempunctata TaxID=41139 RepID=UPI001D09084D|nr:ATP-binding cassette sub-family C member 4-like [Coccinella septempunctata]